MSYGEVIGRYIQEKMEFFHSQNQGQFQLNLWNIKKKKSKDDFFSQFLELVLHTAVFCKDALSF